MIPPNIGILPTRISSEVYCATVTTIKQLCVLARIPYKYAGGNLPYIGVLSGTGNLRAVDRNNHSVLVVDREQFSARNSEEEALRVLEVLAHSHHQYAARECVRGMFGFTQRRSPDDELPTRIPKTASQRKALHRARAGENGLCRVCLVREGRPNRTTCAACASNHLHAQRRRRTRERNATKLILAIPDNPPARV